MQAPEPFEPYTQSMQPHPAEEHILGQPEHTPPRRRWAKVLLWIGIILFALVAFLYNLPHILNLVTSDIPSIDDSDLMPAVRNVPMEENGWWFVEELNAEVERTGLGKEPLKELLKNPDSAKVQALLEKNAHALALFRRIADSPDYQELVLANPREYEGSSLTSLSGLRPATTLALIDAQHALREGDATSTLESVRQSLAVATHVARPNTTLIGVLVSMSLRGEVYGVLEEWVERGQLRELSLSDLARMLEEKGVHTLRTGVKNGFQIEYAMSAEFFTQLDRTQPFVPQLLRSYCSAETLGATEACVEGFESDFFFPLSNYYYRPNESQQMFADVYRANIGAMDQECGLYVAPELVRTGIMDRPIRMYFEENALGKVIHDTLAVHLSASVSEKVCDLERRHARLVSLYKE